MPDCRTCGHLPPERKAIFGCETAAEAPVWWSSCNPCEGVACATCNGDRRLPHYRCPGQEIAQYPAPLVAHVNRAMTAYSQYHGRHVLPARGGWGDQSAGFAAFVEAVDSERAHWEEVREEKERRKQERQKSAQVQQQLYGGRRRG